MKKLAAILVGTPRAVVSTAAAENYSNGNGSLTELLRMSNPTEAGGREPPGRHPFPGALRPI